MGLKIEPINYQSFKKNGTSSQDFQDDLHTVDYPFDKFVVKVKLNPANQFVGIEEISINKDFLSFQQKNQIVNYHDIDKYYSD